MIQSAASMPPYSATISCEQNQFVQERMVTVLDLVTFDFHNTIATCDPWFHLEIRDLPAEVFADIDPFILESIDRSEVTAAYRRLRQGVIACGKEIDALESTIRIAEEFRLDLDHGDIEASIARLMRDTLEHAAPIPGVIDGIRKVAAMGIPIGVVSSAVYHPFLDWTLDAFGIGFHFKFVVTSADCGHYKSVPEIYHHAMSLTDASPARSIHIGDSLKWDVMMAQKAGMRAIWFSNGNVDTFVGQPFESNPDAIIHSMSEIPSLIARELEVTAP